MKLHLMQFCEMRLLCLFAAGAESAGMGEIYPAREAGTVLFRLEKFAGLLYTYNMAFHKNASDAIL